MECQYPGTYKHLLLSATAVQTCRLFCIAEGLPSDLQLCQMHSICQRPFSASTLKLHLHSQKPIEEVLFQKTMSYFISDLWNTWANHQLNVSMSGNLLKHDPNPVYLGVTLDRTLSYKEHLSKTAAKLKSRNNLLSKLAGSSWGANAKTLRTSALALCYSVAEYCCPAWSRSSHMASIDSQLNNTMRLISGGVRPTQTPWLPVLANIAPPSS